MYDMYKLGQLNALEKLGIAKQIGSFLHRLGPVKTLTGVGTLAGGLGGALSGDNFSYNRMLRGALLGGLGGAGAGAGFHVLKNKIPSASVNRAMSKVKPFQAPQIDIRLKPNLNLNELGKL
ncbi:MAG: hypothetical protein PVI90_00045 [Desulfobacteraceae bacterium]|jgi:hypothetical protein